MESLQDFAYQRGKFYTDVVCVDSSFIETKKMEEDSTYSGHKKGKA